jgi:diadenosine tetraphosphatase ApaH/serine/threonine PP2A family protein phosphatase
LEALTAVLEHIDAAGVDQIICLGDVVGYNANPNECVELMRERDVPTICGNHDAVACGISEPWGFNPVALHAAMWTREALSEDNLQWLRKLPDTMRFGGDGAPYFLAVHGSPTNRDTYMFGWEDVLAHLDYLREQECKLCFFGHTHCPGIFSTDGVYTVDDDSRFVLNGDDQGEPNREFFINSGSVGQPRDGDPRAAYGLLDTGSLEYELVRVPYPVDEASSRIMDTGLPQFLAERLYQGR